MSTELIKAQVSDNALIAESLVVNSPESVADAVTLLSNANKLADRAKKEKEKVTRPLLEALNAERARWKPLEERCASIVATLKGKILAYNKSVEEVNAKKEAQLLARVERGTMRADTAAMRLSELSETAAPVSTNAGSIQYRTVKKLVISDVSLVPREYLVPDEAKIKDALKAGVAVAGCALVEEKLLANVR